MDFIIKNATIIHKGHPHHLNKMDILIENGLITKLGKSIKTTEETQKIQGKDLHICIGLCDIGTHTGEPGYEYRETMNSLTKSALKGGYTALAIFPNNKPITQTKADINFLKNHADSNGVTVYPIGTLSKDAKGIDIAEYLDMHLVKQRVNPYSTKLVQNDELLSSADACFRGRLEFV